MFWLPGASENTSGDLSLGSKFCAHKLSVLDQENWSLDTKLKVNLPRVLSMIINPNRLLLNLDMSTIIIDLFSEAIICRKKTVCQFSMQIRLVFC